MLSSSIGMKRETDDDDDDVRPDDRVYRSPHRRQSNVNSNAAASQPPLQHHQHRLRQHGNNNNHMFTDAKESSDKNVSILSQHQKRQSLAPPQQSHQQQPTSSKQSSSSSSSSSSGSSSSSSSSSASSSSSSASSSSSSAKNGGEPIRRVSVDNVPASDDDEGDDNEAEAGIDDQYVRADGEESSGDELSIDAPPISDDESPAPSHPHPTSATSSASPQKQAPPRIILKPPPNLKFEPQDFDDQELDGYEEADAEENGDEEEDEDVFEDEEEELTSTSNVIPDDSNVTNTDHQIYQDAEEEEEDEEDERGDGQNGNVANEDEEGEDEEKKDAPEISSDDLNEYGVFKWKEFSGALVKPYTAEQYRAMQLPFHLGWKRELVIRGTSTVEKKAGDVYYYPPDGSTKLRSYVELNGYLRDHPQCNLSKDNFTYSKQPVWRPPDEIVRAALARGCNYVKRPLYFQQATASAYKSSRGRGLSRGGTPLPNPISPPKFKSENEGAANSKIRDAKSNQMMASNSAQSSGGGGPGFGRGKRKRVLPSRYDEDSYTLLPTALVKKSKNQHGGNSFLRESLSNGNSQDSMLVNGGGRSIQASAAGQLSSAKLERRMNLQKQLLQQVVLEDSLKRAAKQQAENSNEHLKRKIKDRDSIIMDHRGSNQSSPLPLKIKLDNGNKQQQQQQQQQGIQLRRSVKRPHSGDPDTVAAASGTSHGRSILDSSAASNQHQTKQQASYQQDDELEPDIDDYDDCQEMNDDDENGAEDRTTPAATAADDEDADELEEGVATNQPRQPCNAHCAGRRNMLPNLMCSRCFCLFHLDCVPDGMFLQEPTRFVCPNCLSPEDTLVPNKQPASASSNKEIGGGRKLANGGDGGNHHEAAAAVPSSMIDSSYHSILPQKPSMLRGALKPSSGGNNSSSLLRNSMLNGGFASSSSMNGDRSMIMRNQQQQQPQQQQQQQTSSNMMLASVMKFRKRGGASNIVPPVSAKSSPSSSSNMPNGGARMIPNFTSVPQHHSQKLPNMRSSNGSAYGTFMSKSGNKSGSFQSSSQETMPLSFESIRQPRYNNSSMHQTQQQSQSGSYPQMYRLQETTTGQGQYQMTMVRDHSGKNFGFNSHQSQQQHQQSNPQNYQQAAGSLLKPRHPQQSQQYLSNFKQTAQRFQTHQQSQYSNSLPPQQQRQLSATHRNIQSMVNSHPSHPTHRSLDASGGASLKQLQSTITPYSSKILENRLLTLTDTGDRLRYKSKQPQQQHQLQKQKQKDLPISSAKTNEYAKYLNKTHMSVLNGFSSSLQALIKIFDYLDTRDIVALRQASRFWREITSLSPIWTRLRFRALPIVDWSHLSSKIIGANMVTLLDFEGVKIPVTLQNDRETIDDAKIDDVQDPKQQQDNEQPSPNRSNEAAAETEVESRPREKESKKSFGRMEKIVTFWKSFYRLHHHLSSVRVLKFGTVPLFVLQDLVGLSRDQPIDTFASLRQLSILNLFDDRNEASDKPIRLEDFFSSIVAFKAVTSLRLESKSGFILGNESTERRQELMNAAVQALRQFKNLSSFSINTIRDATPMEFARLLDCFESLDQIERLELGSCHNWFKEEMDDEEVGENGATNHDNDNHPVDLISRCANVRTLKLVDVDVTAKANKLVELFESMIVVERLTFESLKISDEAFFAWTSLTAIFKSLPLRDLRFSSSDAFTNRAIFDTARELISTQKRNLRIDWVVTVRIDDSGHCYVPIAAETFPQAPRDVDFVKRYLQSSPTTSTMIKRSKIGDDDDHDDDGEDDDDDDSVVAATAAASATATITAVADPDPQAAAEQGGPQQSQQLYQVVEDEDELDDVADDDQEQKPQDEEQQNEEEQDYNRKSATKRKTKTTILIEIATLTDVMNRDVNLNSFAGHEPKVTVNIIPQ